MTDSMVPTAVSAAAGSMFDLLATSSTKLSIVWVGSALILYWFTTGLRACDRFLQLRTFTDSQGACLRSPILSANGCATMHPKMGSHAPGHKLKVVVPAMGAGLCLIRIPLSVAVLLLFGGASAIVLVPGTCGCLLWCLFGLGRFLRRGGLGAIVGGKVLAALAPEARPCLVPGLSSSFHVIPLFATGFHCGCLGRC